MDLKLFRKSILTALCITVFLSLSLIAFAADLNMTSQCGDYYWHSMATVGVDVNYEAELLIPSTAYLDTDSGIWPPGTYTLYSESFVNSTTLASSYVDGHFGWFGSGWNAKAYAYAQPIDVVGGYAYEY